ncbi:RNA-binding protein [Mucilaginibacter hurinus]|uniref:RNA-binding protein n=1 Tax=Mucilaginibacter hurinus TaxID=2201324 RepID=A0A367GQZ4_9SPHI|nr:RNA-binding protein [Mucilaginibacter hurinus]RCH55862.1 RNA-binding protein [Mucilaginibacter hurinus]
MTKIFFGGFPLDTNELEIVQLVSLYGQVETIKIVRDKQTRKCKGYAFLEMKDREAADAAIDALDGAMMGDRVLKVSIAPDKPAAKPFRPSSYVKINRPSTDQRPRRPRK